MALFRSAAVLSLSLYLLICPHPAQARSILTKVHAIWVYPDPAQPGNNPVLNAAAGQQLIANARASKVNMIYLSVYNSTPNSKARYMYDETLIANFVAAARFASMQVYAAYGAPDWPTLGCGTAGSPSFPIQRLQEIGAYNTPFPTAMVFDPITNASYQVTAQFNGVILDVEPSTADQNLLNLYACAQTTALQYSFGLSVAINAFWNDPIGAGGPAYKQILDMGFVNVVIMGYRNLAGTFGSIDNGILDIDKNVVTYKNNSSTVLVGLETKNLGADDPANIQSFHSFGQAALDYQAQSVYNQLFANGYDFGGFAVHNYTDSYLGGTAAWPSANPLFPMGVSIQPVSAGVATTVTVGTAEVAITFPNLSNANATVTVTPLNPATQTPTPTGFQLTNLAFDVSTTAVFTGPATVCFYVPSLDAAAFATLRVLHYLAGVPVDQTILSGPNAPNAAAKTICASVNSFSPFVLAKSTVVAMPGFRVHSLNIGKAIFYLNGDLTLPAGAQVNAGDEISLTLGTALLKVPAGQLKKDGQSGYFTFAGVVNGGTKLGIELKRDSNQAYQFGIVGLQLDLTAQAQPMRVQLQIGKYLGSAIVLARVEN